MAAGGRATNYGPRAALAIGRGGRGVKEKAGCNELPAWSTIHRGSSTVVSVNPRWYGRPVILPDGTRPQMARHHCGHLIIEPADGRAEDRALRWRRTLHQRRVRVGQGFEQQ